MILADIDSVTVRHARGDILRSVSLTISSGDRVGVVGHNGSGKTTLLRVLTGDLTPDEGVVRRPQGITTATLDQQPKLDADTTVRAVIGDGWEAAAILDRMGLAGAEDRRIDSMSGGERRRVALTRALTAPADLLVLDEPTNHMDIDAIDWLEERLSTFRGGLLVVSHDRHLLDAVTTKIVEVDDGALHLHEGGYRGYLEGRDARRQAADDAEAVRRNLARREREWLLRGAPARTRKPKAHIRRAEALQQSTQTHSLRDDPLPLHVETPRLGDVVIELDQVDLTVADRTLISGLTLALDPLERLGIVGPNGAGKTTLLDAMAGRRSPAAGQVRQGETVRLGYFDQMGRDLDPAQRVIDLFAGDRGAADWRDKALLERFWFDAATQRSPVGDLSGGERRRLQLVLVLAQNPNVLMLDEPTNDLDLDTLRSLEAFLDDWPGAVVAVSHDRAFLERVVTDVIVVDESTTAGRVPGGLAAWINARRLARRRGQAHGGRKPKPAAGARTATADDGERTDEPSQPSRSTLRHRLKEIDRAMAKQQRAVDEHQAALTDAMADPDDHDAIAAAGAALADSQQALAELEERWMEISLQLEEY